jgi:hypothetical protein
MTVIRLSDGRLVIHNGISFEEDAMRANGPAQIFA